MVAHICTHGQDGCPEFKACWLAASPKPTRAVQKEEKSNESQRTGRKARAGGHTKAVGSHRRRKEGTETCQVWCGSSLLTAVGTVREGSRASGYVLP